ncbi:MAG: hypothetical protein EXR71_18725 [Myxococcales bacterium]|nr:hypothetical protein [Myxococcales bacterium]
MLLVSLWGCAVHLGTIPTPGFSLVELRAPVVEPGVDEAVRGAVIEALATRAASGSTPLTLSVERADWRPGRRSGTVVVYDATLSVRFVTGTRVRVVTATAPYPDPGSAGLADTLGHSGFQDLARRVAAEGVAWLVLGQ